MTQEFENMLRTDPLLEAERITGKSYKEDAETSALGMLLYMQKSEAVADEMELRDDTHYNTPFQTTVRIYLELGFTVVLTDTFEGRTGKDVNVILWRDGVLARIASYNCGEGKIRTNSSDIYGNWLPNPAARESRWDYTSSGHFGRRTPGFDGELEDDPWTWIGHWDARTGLRNLIDRLDNAGTFVVPWIEPPIMSLSNYMEGREAGVDSLQDRTDRVIKRLPLFVQEGMGLL